MVDTNTNLGICTLKINIRTLHMSQRDKFIRFYIKALSNWFMQATGD